MEKKIRKTQTINENQVLYNLSSGRHFQFTWIDPLLPSGTASWLNSHNHNIAPAQQHGITFRPAKIKSSK
jgi:hypothetical protein